MRIIFTYCLTLMLIFFVFNTVNADLKNNLVANYTLDGHCLDKSGNNNNGKCTETSEPLYSMGKYYKAGIFDGIETRIATGIDRASMQDFTICGWYKFQGTINDHFRALFGNIEGTFFVGKDSGTSNIGVQDGEYIPNFATDTNAWDGNWHHLCYTRRESISKIGSIFLDGERVSESSFSGGSSEMYIGFENGDPDNFSFKGLIDSVLIFNKGLSELEILSIYQNTPPQAEEIMNIEVYNNEITLNASNSTDIDGDISSFEWYLKCRGNEKFNVSSQGLVTKILLQPGFYDGTLVLMDNYGATSYSDFVIFSGIGVKGDINADGKIGLEETVYSLKAVSELK